jgi:PPOX class probable F420-dependent enzyme
VIADVPGWALDLLREARVARLGTADASGRPLVVPVCYAFDGERLYSVIDAKPKRTRDLRRLRNIADNPRVSLVVDDYHEDWARLRWVILEGRADVLTDGAEYAGGVDLLLAKYPQYRALGLDRARGLLIRVTPERLLSWSYA